MRGWNSKLKAEKKKLKKEFTKEIECFELEQEFKRFRICRSR